MFTVVAELVLSRRRAAWLIVSCTISSSATKRLKESDLIGDPNNSLEIQKQPSLAYINVILTWAFYYQYLGAFHNSELFGYKAAQGLH